MSRSPRAKVNKLELRLDCDICGKPVDDRARVFMFCKGTFNKVGMAMESTDGEVFGHEGCYLLISKGKETQVPIALHTETTAGNKGQ